MLFLLLHIALPYKDWFRRNASHAIIGVAILQVVMNIEDTILYIVILIMSVVIHEVAHGYAADALGDRTARYQGRLTINPLPHLDLFGSVILPALLVFSGAPFLVGWAKPVPFNLANIRNKKWGPALIALAGPGANLSLALIFAALMRINEGVGFFAPQVMSVFSAVVLVNIVLMCFNLIPVPPLDGHHVLFSILSHPKYSRIRSFMMHYRFVLVLIALFVVWPVMRPLIFGLYQLLV